jgi:hypothetical protein
MNESDASRWLKISLNTYFLRISILSFKVETDPDFIFFNFSKVVKSTQNATDSNT